MGLCARMYCCHTRFCCSNCRNREDLNQTALSSASRRTLDQPVDPPDHTTAEKARTPSSLNDSSSSSSLPCCFVMPKACLFLFDDNGHGSGWQASARRNAIQRGDFARPGLAFRFVVKTNAHLPISMHAAGEQKERTVAIYY
jgi:hypothetical protein